jgi:hypothetical protein
LTNQEKNVVNVVWSQNGARTKHKQLTLTTFTMTKILGMKNHSSPYSIFGNGNMGYIEMTKYLGIPKLSSYEFHYFVNS